jgi:hypothetical protein
MREAPEPSRDNRHYFAGAIIRASCISPLLQTFKLITQLQIVAHVLKRNLNLKLLTIIFPLGRRVKFKRRLMFGLLISNLAFQSKLKPLGVDLQFTDY